MKTKGDKKTKAFNSCRCETSPPISLSLLMQFFLAHTHTAAHCHFLVATVLGKEKPSCRRGRERMQKTSREEEATARPPSSSSSSSPKSVSLIGGGGSRPLPPLAAFAKATTAAAAAVAIVCQMPGEQRLGSLIVVACKCHPQAHLASPLQLLVEMEARAGQLWILMAFSR